MAIKKKNENIADQIINGTFNSNKLQNPVEKTNIVERVQQRANNIMNNNITTKSNVNILATKESQKTKTGIWDNVKRRAMSTTNQNMQKARTTQINSNNFLNMSQQDRINNSKINQQRTPFLMNKKNEEKQDNTSQNPLQWKETRKLADISKGLPSAKNVSDETLYNISNIKDKTERDKTIRGLAKSKKEQDKLRTKVNALVQERETSEKANTINSRIETAGFIQNQFNRLTGNEYHLDKAYTGLQAGKRFASSLGQGALNYGLDIAGTMQSLSPQSDDNFVNTAKQLGSRNSQVNAKIKNPVVSGAGRAGETIGFMIPSIVASAVAPESKISGVVNAVGVGSSGYLENLDEEQTNKLESLLTGVAKGAVSYKIEQLSDGNFLSKGKSSLSKEQVKGLSNVSNNMVKWFKAKASEIGGEVVEENLENVAGYIIDYLINEKKITADELIEEAKQTSIDTFTTTALLNVLGLGGNTYRQSQQYETSRDLLFNTNLDNTAKDIILNDVLEGKRTSNDIFALLYGQSDTELNNQIIDSSKMDENSKQAMKKVAEENELGINEVQYLIDNTLQGKYAQNQSTTMQNKEVSQNNQQIIQEQSKTAQNGNMGQTKQDNFKTGLDKFKSKQYNQSDNIEVLNKLPEQFYNLGYNIEQPLYLNMNKLENIMKEPKGTVNGVNQHGITMDIIEQLPEALNEPLNIIKNPKFRNRFVMVTSLTDQYGDMIVVPVEINHENAEVQGISKINSIYGKETYDLPKDNSNRSYMEQNKDNIVYDIDNNRSGSSNYRLQLSSETTNAPSNVDTVDDVSTINNSIPQNEKNNNNFEEKNTDNSQEKFFNKKKVLNPAEIGNLNEEDANTTPNLNKKHYEKGRKQSSFYSNIVNDSKFINEDWRQELSKEENIKYYKEITNKDTLAKAYKSLNEDGKNATLNWLNKNSQNASAEDVAKGWILLKQYQDKGNYESAVEVAKKMRDMGTKAGQTVQAYNILSRLTPEGMFYYVQSELSEAYNIMVKGKSEKWINKHQTEFDLTPTETQFIMDNMKEIANMEDGREKKIKLAEIQKLVQDKIPPTAGQGIKAWMRISMLLNPKTLHRNFLGNAVMVPVNIGSDIVSTGIDKAIAKKTGVRTTGLTNPKQYAKGFGKGLFESYDDFRRGINTREVEGNKFEIGEGKSFKDKGIGKALNRLDNVLNFALDSGDRPFYEATFTNSINNQLVLNNTTEVTQDMIDIATDEALQRTWQDDNEYTKTVLTIRKALNKVGGKGYGLGDVLIPFAKTPANLTKAIVDYSPVGLIKTLTLDAKNFKNSLENGQYTPQMQHQFVQNLGKGMVGSVLYVIGNALAKSGIATGEADDDKDVKNFLKNSLGISSYSITIGDKSFAYDWAQPVATPLAIMTNYQKYSKNNPDANALEGIWQSMNIGTEQLLEQSFMESLNTVLNGNGTTLENLTKALFDLPARAIPTFSKQIADMVDGTQRTTFEYDKPFQSAINSAKAKIPGLSMQLPVARDTLGNEVKKYGGNNNVWNVFFNPANMNKGSLSKAGAEIYRLYQETGETTMFPITAPYYINYKGDKIIMTSDERQKFQMATGQYTEKAVNNLLSNSSYKDLSEEEKVDLISEIIGDSNAKAKYEVLNIESEEASKKRKLIEQISTDNYYDYKLNVMAETNKKRVETKKKDAQLNDTEKMKIITNEKYSSKAKEAIYNTYIKKEDSKEYDELKEYYANNSTLGAKNQRAYEIIDSYLDYKVKANEKLQELKAKGEATEKANNLNDKEATQLLVNCKYPTTRTEALYINVIASDTNKEKYENIKKMNGGNQINNYLKYVLADKESDKKDDGTKNGETISGTKKKKVVSAIQNTTLNPISKIYLLGTEYDLNTNVELNNYYTLKNYILKQSKEDQIRIVKTLKGKVEMKDGSFNW